MQPITKLLVANRGEIALRIIRTAQDMGIKTVAVYAEQDLQAQYAELADEAYALGGATIGDTYMDQDKILAIAAQTGADAVHPGYGFLAENADFAQAVVQAGMTWVGPAAASINKLGDKIKARRVATSVQVSPVPGVNDPVSGKEAVEAFVAEHGFPVVLKRADGGGGRGIYRLDSETDTVNFFTQHGGSKDLELFFVERFVSDARHIETQCARDSHGNFQVVTTRDCSVQRRNQKLIEEAPAPDLSAETDEKLVQWSKALFEAVDYVGLGTCEFLLEGSKNLYFLEVNPRLQVEHPVSEEVAGIDLVREQLIIAGGGQLTKVETRRGHSIEVRITSENPAAGLMPTGGLVSKIIWPNGPGLRIDPGIREGEHVATNFDSMLAKVIVTGANRAEAIARAKRALRECVIEGVPTPISIYEAILDTPEFQGTDGFGVTTKWLENTVLTDETLIQAASPASNGNGNGVAEAAGPELRTTCVIELDGRRMELTLPGNLLQAAQVGPGKAPQVQPLRSNRNHTSRAGAGSHEEKLAADGTLVSPMQAIVIRNCVEAGQQVSEGHLLVVLEAMKMETYIHAPCAGTVEEILAQPGENVTAGAALLRLVKDES